MSLFGDEETAAPAKSRVSLFDDESPAPGSKSSLFADDEPTSSPWGMPTPKKAGRGDLLKNLLPAADVPDSYIDIFDDLLKEGESSGGKVNSTDVGRVLSAGGVNAEQANKIMGIVAPNGGAELSRNEFNVLLALIGLAQEFEDVTLDGVDERRRSKQSSIEIMNIVNF